MKPKRYLPAIKMHRYIEERARHQRSGQPHTSIRKMLGLGPRFILRQRYVRGHIGVAHESN